MANSTCQPSLTARFSAGIPKWASAVAIPPGVTITVGCSRPPAGAAQRGTRPCRRPSCHSPANTSHGVAMVTGSQMAPSSHTTHATPSTAFCSGVSNQPVS